MRALGVIPARGGSKGVPRKNIKPLAGKPLIAWVLNAAKNSKHVNRVIVSTDDQEIADVAREYGGEIPFMRPAELAVDLSTDMDYLTHVLNELREREGYVPDVVV